MGTPRAMPGVVLAWSHRRGRADEGDDMGRWLAPLVGVVGLLTLVGGVVWAELDVHTMGGVPLVGVGGVLLLAAAVVAATVEGATRRRDAHPR
jgi:peptidoglycan/LPS O-acetylase OafA/YrhL